jgi:hypothetical protein
MDDGNMLLHVLCRQHLLKHHVAAGNKIECVLDQAAVRSDQTYS